MPGNEKRVRVLVINHWARHLGGAEYSLIDILTELSKRAEVHLLTSEDGALTERLRGSAVKCTVVPCVPNVLEIKRDRLVRSMLSGWKAMAAFARFFFKVRCHVNRIRPDCIYANIPKSHMTLFLLVLTGYRGGAVAHMREIFERTSFGYRLYEILFPQRGVGIIAISEAVRGALPPRLRAAATVIYNGISVAIPLQQSRIAAPIKFLYLGRIVPWKGCHLLIEAFDKALRRLPAGAATLNLTGATIYWDRSYRQELTCLINDRHLEGAVTLNEPTDDPLTVLRNHHVLCMASTNEPFGRVAAEAMGCGLPVIGFSTGGLIEVVQDGETGVLVADGDVKGLAEAMVSFVNDPGRIATMGTAGITRASQLFNREKQVQLITGFVLEHAPHRSGWSR